VTPSRHAVATVLGVALLLLAGPAWADTDPYRPQQWALDRIGAPAAWEVARGAGQVVAVIDSGVDLEHPDLAEQLFRDASGTVVGRDFVDGDDDPRDLNGHGTMVAGVVAAATDNGFGVAGVAPDARIMPIRVLDEKGEGFGADVDKAIRWAVDHGATIVNLSLESDEVALTGVGGRLAAPAAAVRYAWDRGVIVVAAAGNSGSDFTDYPATSPIVLVGATDRADRRTSFSDAGRDDLLMAPGVDIVSTWCRPRESTVCDLQTHNFGVAEGTSFAAPHVAGALAVLRSTGLGPADAVARLRETARDLGPAGRDPETGYGLIDLAAAVGTASTSPPPTTPPVEPTTPPETTPDDPSPAPPPRIEPTPSDPVTTPPTDSPTATPEPAPSETTGARPDPAGPQVATPPLPTDRGPWPAIATVVVLGTAGAVGRARPLARR
jgi:subtilisin family serine protease